MRKFLDFNRNALLDILLVLGVVLIAFLPIFTHTYAYHNDLGFWAYGNPGHDHHMFWETGHVIIFGRPIGAILLNLQAFAIRHLRGIEGLSLVRLIGIFLLGAVLILVDSILRRQTKIGRFERITFLLLLALQPSWALGTLWITNHISQYLGTIFGLTAGLCVDFLLVQKNPSWRPWLLPTGLFFIAFLTYPASACAFFWPFIIPCVFGNRISFSQLLKILSFFGGACLLSLILQKWPLRPLLCDTGYIYCVTWTQESYGNYSMHFSFDILAKIATMWDSIKISAGSWLVLKYGPTAVMGIVALVSLFFLSIRSKNAAWLLFCVILLNLPNLVTKASIIAFRTATPNTIWFPLFLSGLTTLGRLPRSLRVSARLVAILMLGILSYSHLNRLTSGYQDAWTSWRSTPGLPSLCLRGAENREFDTLATHHPQSHLLLETESVRENRDFDFGLANYPAWALRGICHLENKPGSPFYGSAPGP